MKAGYYKLIDREGYLSSHQNNSNILQVYGHTLHVQGRGIAVVCKDVLHPATVLIYGSEVDFFEYLGETLPKPVTKPVPVYRRNKRTPKAGEVWTSFGAYVEQQFYNIHRITGPVGARKVVFTRLGSKRVCTMGMSKFCRQPTAVFNGHVQYRTFSH